jgi:surface antigen
MTITFFLYRSFGRSIPGACVARRSLWLVAMLVFLLAHSRIALGQFPSPDLANPAYGANNQYSKLVGQCTWYVYGRVQELGLKGIVATTKEQKDVLTVINGVGADMWFDRAKDAGLETGKDARPGAIACWPHVTAKFGHVAFVEGLGKAGQPLVTESNIRTPTLAHVIAMTMVDEAQKPMLLYLNRDGTQEVGEVRIGQTRSVKDLGDLKSATTGWCQLVAEQEDFNARAAQLQKSPEEYRASSEGQHFAPWAERYWTTKAEGNFTGIGLSPGEAAYLATAGPPEYIYLASPVDASTKTAPVKPVTAAVVLKLHGDVGLNQPVVASVSEGTTLEVMDGPVQGGAYVWWKLTGTPGTGWAAVEVKPNTIFSAPKECAVEVAAQYLWFHGSLKAQGTFYVATRDNVLFEQASLASRKIKDLPVGTQDTVIGGPNQADGRVWWNLTVGPDTGWAVVDRWGFTYPKE